MSTFWARTWQFSSAYFQFPMIRHGSEIIAKENENVSISFKLHLEDDCDPSKTHLLHVSKVTTQSKVQCLLLHEVGVCKARQNNSNCTCNPTTGMYQLLHVPDRTDNWPTHWIWSVNNVQQRNITFNVLYPPEVTSLSQRAGQTVITSPVDQNTSVDINCTWDAGNPPAAAHLLDRHGAILKAASDVTGEIRYRFAAVGCQDAGLIYCQAPGAKHNLTTTLLVRCAPVILLVKLHMSREGTASLQLRVRAHSKEFKQCMVLQSRTGDVCTVTAVTGSPPDLTVSVRLDNVGTQDQGTWRLTLTNDVGNGELDLTVIIEEGQLVGTSSANPTDVKTDGNGFISSTNYTATVIAAVVIVCVVSLSVTIICIVRGPRSNKLEPVRQVEEPANQQQSLLDDVNRSSTESEESSHTYHEVDDDAPEQVPLGAIRPTRHCQAPCEDHSAYLHPSASLPELSSDSAQSPDTFQNEKTNPQSGKAVGPMSAAVCPLTTVRGPTAGDVGPMAFCALGQDAGEALRREPQYQN